MPNWCNNEVVISGSPAQITRLLEKGRGDEGRFFLSNIYPCPENLRKVSAGSEEDFYRVKHGTTTEWERYRSYEWVAKLNGGEAPTTREQVIAALEKRHSDFHEKADQYKRNLEEHGHATWYTWCVANWGTKWDIEAHIAPRDENDDTGQLNFDSAWSPPVDAFVEISSQFPELRIECRYFEEGCNFIGVCIIEDGAVVAEDEDSCDSDNLDRFEFAPMREEDWE